MSGPCGASVAVRRLDTSSALSSPQEYEYVVQVNAERVAAVRSDAHLEWLVEETVKKQFKHAAHPTVPKGSGVLRVGGLAPLLRASPDLRSEVLCRYSASIVEYYLSHPAISEACLELHSFASASPPSEISFLMKGGDTEVVPQTSNLGGFMRYPFKKAKKVEPTADLSESRALMGLMPFLKQVDDGSMEELHNYLVAAYIAFEADRRALGAAFNSFGRNLQETAKTALWDLKKIRSSHSLTGLNSPTVSDAQLQSPKLSARSGSEGSQSLSGSTSNLMVTPRDSVLASKLRNREAMRQRVNAQLVQREVQTSPKSPTYQEEAPQSPALEEGNFIDSEGFLKLMGEKKPSQASLTTAPVSFLATPRNFSNREPGLNSSRGSKGMYSSREGSPVLPEARRFASCLGKMGHEAKRDPEDRAGEIATHVGRPKTNAPRDVIDVVASGFEYLAKADEQVTHHCSRCSLSGTVATNLFAGQLYKGAKAVVHQPSSEVSDIAKMDEVKRVKKISGNCFAGTLKVFVQNEVNRHTEDARLLQHLLDVLDDSIDDAEVVSGGDAFAASWNNVTADTFVPVAPETRSPQTADVCNISTATPSPTSEADRSNMVPRLDLSQAGFNNKSQDRRVSDQASDSASYVMIGSEGEKDS